MTGALGVRRSGTGLQLMGVAGRSRELTSGFPRRDLQIIGMKAQSWEVCVTASRELVEASHFPLG